MIMSWIELFAFPLQFFFFARKAHLVCDSSLLTWLILFCSLRRSADIRPNGQEDMGVLAHLCPQYGALRSQRRKFYIPHARMERRLNLDGI